MQIQDLLLSVGRQLSCSVMIKCFQSNILFISIRRNGWEGVLMDFGMGPSQRDGLLFNFCRSMNSKVGLTNAFLLHM